jgi:hypothetical protein
MRVKPHCEINGPELLERSITSRPTAAQLPQFRRVHKQALTRARGVSPSGTWRRSREDCPWQLRNLQEAARWRGRGEVSPHHRHLLRLLLLHLRRPARSPPGPTCALPPSPHRRPAASGTSLGYGPTNAAVPSPWELGRIVPSAIPSRDGSMRTDLLRGADAQRPPASTAGRIRGPAGPPQVLFPLIFPLCVCVHAIKCETRGSVYRTV